MAGTGGFFLKGLAGSLEGMPQRIYDVRWRTKEEKLLKKKEEEFRERMSLYTKTAGDLYEDGFYSKEDISKLNTIIFAGTAEFQKEIKDAHSNIVGLNEAAVKLDMELIDTSMELFENIDLKNIDEAFDMVSEFVQSKDALDKIAAHVSLMKKKLEMEEGKPTTETFTSPEEVLKRHPDSKPKYIPTQNIWVPEFKDTAGTVTPKPSDYNSVANYLSKFADAKPEVFNAIKAGQQKQFPNIDISAITQESLKKPVDIDKPPEGEITAGEKRAWDMASSVMFGSSDWVTGISKPGIISMAISQKLHQGQPLTEEENTEVRNSYNTIKGTLPAEIRSVIESQLKRYGISLEAPAPEVTPEISPEPQPNLLQRGVDKVKSIISSGADMKPIWGLEGQPKGEVPKEAPLVEVPTGEKAAMVPFMSEKELEEAIEGLDPSDPMYQIIYDEALKRGYIKK